MDKASQDKPGLICPAARSVVVVGRPSLQYSLLGGLLERRLGCRCNVGSIEAAKSSRMGPVTIALLDAGTVSGSALETQLYTLCNESSVRAVAIFNCDADMSVERLLNWPKLRGLFQRDTSEEQLIKGLQAILSGEIWLPRKMLCDYLELTRGPHRLRVAEIVDLTRKEKETLRVMVGGASNVDIANTLNISPHTVKTHVYNLFRKIKVSNRVQAVSWALTNLEEAKR